MSVINDIHLCVPNAEDNIQALYIFPPTFYSDSIEKFCKEINHHVNMISNGYIWHKEEFKLFLPIDQHNHEDLPFYLASSTSFGDNIEDEWLIVHLILKLTKQYSNLVVQIKDSDGDFLLIEAADYLPHWATPETTENRVFVCNNHIHLIPPELAEMDVKLRLKDAIQIIMQSPEKTQVSPDIERAILDRIGNYPDKIKDNTHVANVKVPLEIAAVLQLKPNLIAAIVNAYCHQDVVDSKACKKTSYDIWTTVPVRFSKCLYAMLLYSKININWISIHEKDKSLVLGTKLTQGFQIIMKNASDIYSSKEYVKFLKSLNDNGYFKDNIEGSQEYKVLLQKAKDFFSAVECPTTSNVANEITQMMRTNEYLKAKEVLKDTNNSPYAEEDNDDWLTISPDQLNNLLNSRYGKKTKLKKGDTITAHTITNELNFFLKQTSDFEGIETNRESDNNIDFDPDQFVNCVEKMLKLLSSNDEVESIGSEFSDEVMFESDDVEELDKELKGKLQQEENLHDSKNIFENIMESMKEEKASAGPSSNLISSMGFNKMDLLDSDDD